MIRIPIVFFTLFSLTATAQTKDANAVNKFVDAWHKAAADANANVFFGSMADNSIYIGTDATERWTKQEFITFAKPYFDKGKAWDFKPYDRDLHFSGDGAYVWFSELLHTWMGVCRGSGMLHKTPEGWKLEQYHLSVTVPNEIIRDFIQLVEGAKK
ncbi:MAG: nuclear transport factor 2 family protein [Bacteroidia bacterium]|nr:nuclear transport factor 2 family protein [Bacteroidia bacterium]